MLASVSELLRELNLIGRSDEPGYNIALVGKRVFNIGVFAASGVFFHVRVKEVGCLPHEYENYRRAWESFPQYVPRPLCHHVRGEWDIMIVQGVFHRPVSIGELGKGKAGLERDIIEFFDTARKNATVARPSVSHSAFLHQVHARTADPKCASIVEQWVAADQLDGVPQIKQHGDFVVNNLGMANSGLVVFDWEDFGRISFPGFDLCTLLASDLAFNADMLRAIINGAGNGGHPYTELLNRSCSAIGLTPDLFRQLIPLYLVIFMDLKKEYGKAIGQMVSKTIREL